MADIPELLKSLNIDEKRASAYPGEPSAGQGEVSAGQICESAAHGRVSAGQICESASHG